MKTVMLMCCYLWLAGCASVAEKAAELYPECAQPGTCVEVKAEMLGNAARSGNR